jgi:hypothetical protein
MNFVNRVVPAEDCRAEALRVARAIAVNDRVAVALTKRAINRSCEVMGMRQALLQSLELDVSIEASETPESRESTGSSQKRAPRQRPPGKRRGCSRGEVVGGRTRPMSPSGQRGGPPAANIAVRLKVEA